MAADKKNTEDEIDQIMSEIQDLQSSMAEAPKAGAPAPAKAPPPAKAAPAAKVAPAAKAAPAKAPVKLQAVPTPPPAPDPMVAETDSGIPDVDMSDLIAEPGTGSGDSSLEDTMSAMKPEDTGKTLLDEPAADEPAAEEIVAEEVAAAEEEVAAEEVEQEIAMAKPKTAGTPNDGSLSMTLTGSMTLNIKYEFDGQEVSIGFDDGFLQIQLADGTEFKVPVARAAGRLKAVA